MLDQRPEQDGRERQVRLALSRADHHRRRRRIAAAVLGGIVLLLGVLVAVSSGNSGTWDPVRLKNGAVAELPKLRLEDQARKAAAVIAARKRETTLENAAIAATLKQSPYVRVAGDQTRSVALTFDDGPGPYTQRILDTLQRAGAKATFFTLGNQLASFPIPLQRAVAEGHAIGDHTWNHADLTKLSPADVSSEMSDASTALVQAGVPKPRLFRPPYGAFNDQTLATARRKNMLTVLWTIDTSDYSAQSPQAMAQQVLAQARPGAIILMHDGGGNRTVTGEALPLIVRGLKRQGYRMVTVPQLLISNPPPQQQDGATRSPTA